MAAGPGSRAGGDGAAAPGRYRRPRRSKSNGGHGLQPLTDGSRGRCRPNPGTAAGAWSTPLSVWITPDRQLAPSPEHPPGVTPGRSAGGTLGSTGRGRRMPTLAAYLAELHDQGRAPASASSAVAAARFRARRAGEPSPAGGTHRSESSPATGGPPATAAEGRRGRAGRRTSPPSSPPATGPRRRRAGVESDKSPSRRPVPGSPQHRQPSRPASGLAHAFVFPCPVTGQGPDHSPPVCFQSAGARNVDQSINAPCRAGEPPRPRVAAPRALPGRRLFSAGPTPPRRRPPAGTREPAT